jgi:hypothetical protein
MDLLSVNGGVGELSEGYLIQRDLHLHERGVGARVQMCADLWGECGIGVGRCGMLSDPLTTANPTLVSHDEVQNMGSDGCLIPISSVVSPQGREP